MSQLPRQNIAIIGTGISGMAAAYMLHPHHNITVYEKNATIGGHSRTVDVQMDGQTIPVDTGFIVFNYRNYPHLTRMFEHLDVPVIKSDMSFGASIQNGWLEYGTQHTHNIFAQKKNLLKPAFWRMIADVMRFNKQARRYLEADSSVTLGQCLDGLKMGEWFRNYYLLAIGGAIWSTPLSKMMDFPAKTFVRFFDNHGLLTVNDQPQWYTVQGGSQEYVKRLTESYKGRIRTNCGAIAVSRSAEGVTVKDSQGGSALYDQVIFACHSDQALALIDQPNEAEQTVLGRMQYHPNEMILHSDTSFMPKNKNAWASWVYMSEGRRDDTSHVSLSYWMNRLQSLKSERPLIVTLNPGRAPNPALVHDNCQFEHPLFDEGAILSQQQLGEIQGKDRLWFCGAYQRYGFHEDGLGSAVTLVSQFGISPQWT